jgi:hypothetical protein
MYVYILINQIFLKPYIFNEKYRRHHNEIQKQLKTDEGNQALNDHVVLMTCMGLEQYFTWKCKCALFTMIIVELHLAWKSPHLDMMQSNSFVALQYTESTNTWTWVARLMCVVHSHFYWLGQESFATEIKYGDRMCQLKACIYITAIYIPILRPYLTSWPCQYTLYMA